MIQKKKVSFDMDTIILSDIKKLCQSKNMKLADFLRSAAGEKLQRDKDYLIIFVPQGGKIEKFSIEKNNFEIDIFEASENMQENVSAKCEGILRLNNNNFDETPLHKIIKNSPQEKISFFTKEKYC